MNYISIDQQVEDYREGYCNAIRQSPDPNWWTYGTEYGLGYCRGVADKDRGEVDLNGAVAACKRRLEADRRKRLGEE